MTKVLTYIAALITVAAFFVALYFIWKHQIETAISTLLLPRAAGQPQP